MEYDRSKLDWVDHPTQIFVVHSDDILFATSTEQGAEAAIATRKLKNVGVKEITLHRPSLRAVYGGPTLIEALWAEMDSIMERLMTLNTAEDRCQQNCNWEKHLKETGRADFAGCDHIDNGDKYRAQELAWVLAIVTNAYDPSVDRIRKEAMDRWNAAQAEADQDDMMTRPEGADQ